MDDTRYPQPRLPRVMRGPVKMHGLTARQRTRDLNRLAAEKMLARKRIEAKYTPLEIETYRCRLCDHCTHEFAINSARTCRLAVLPVTLAGGDCPYFTPGRTEEAKKEPGEEVANPGSAP